MVDSSGKQKQISLSKDTGPHSCFDIEWWYSYAFVNGDRGGKYAVMSAFYQVGELPVSKGHYVIFSLIDLGGVGRSFSLIDKKLAQNMVFINIPLYLLQFPLDKHIQELYLKLIQKKLPLPHRWLSNASIKEDPVSLLYGDTSIIYRDKENGQLEVTLAGDGIEAKLEFSPVKPVSLIGGYGKPDRLFYYSFTRNEVNGYVKKGDSTEKVSGEGWFDHQWGYAGDLFLKTGWNWMGLQLEDGRELLLNEFRSVKSGKTFSPMANLIEPDGRLRFTRNLILQPLDYWRSPVTKADYPLRWNIIIPEFYMNLNVSALLNEQEMPVIGPLNAIWEGACAVSGTEIRSSEAVPVAGRGFLELVGYANSNR